jgi:hypothetical protein
MNFRRPLVNHGHTDLNLLLDVEGLDGLAEVRDVLDLFNLLIRLLRVLLQGHVLVSLAQLAAKLVNAF